MTNSTFRGVLDGKEIKEGKINPIIVFDSGK